MRARLSLVVLMCRLALPAAAGDFAQPVAAGPHRQLNPPVPCDTGQGTCYAPPVQARWQWQLTGVVNTTYDVAVYDIDLFDTPQTTIDDLHTAGRGVICYFSAGSFEDWRPDAGSFPAEVLGKKLDQWPGERWLDVRRLDLLGPIIAARLDLAAAKGCDGVEPDNVDGYTNDTGFALTYEDQLAYNVWLAEQAHTRGLSIALKNDLDQITDLVDYFDWALNEQCFQYDECDRLLPFIQAGKAVLGVEYELDRADYCPLANAMSFSWLTKTYDLADEPPGSCLDYVTDFPPPEPKTPRNRSAIADSTPRFRWGTTQGAPQYLFQLSAEPDFASILVEELVPRTTYILPDALTYSMYFWRVQAADIAGTGGDWSRVFAFTVTLLKAPQNGAFTTDDTPAFRWTQENGANQYQLQVATDPGFVNRVIDELVFDSRYTPGSGLGDGVYFWRVQADTGGAWTPAWVVTVTPPPPGKPALAVPENHADLAGPAPVFSWESVPGGDTYQIQIDDQSSFAGPVQDAVVGGLTYTADALADSGTYYWRVRAINDVGVAGKWSGKRSFTLGGPDAPALLSPEHKTVSASNTPDFAWDGVAGFTVYQIQIAQDKTFVYTDQETTVTGQGYTAAALVDGVYYWRVRTVKMDGVGGPWSEVWRVTVDTTGPDAPVLKTPRDASGAPDTAPRFRWNRPAGAEDYRLQVVGESTTVFDGPVTGTSTTLPNPLAYGRYTWYVQARDAVGNWGGWSSPFFFTVTILKAPHDATSTTDTTPTFTWRAVDGVASYQLQVAADAGFTSLVINETVSAATFTPAGDLAYGSYYWRVSVDGGTTWMPAWTLIITPPLPGKPKPESPVRNATINTSEPVFTWRYAPGGYAYQFQIDRDKGFHNPVQDVVLIPGVLTYTASPLSEDVVYWRVRAINSAGAPGKWSARWRFTVDVTPPAVPIPTGPAEGARITNIKFTLAWTGVKGAAAYEIQLDPDPAFLLPPVNVGRQTRYRPPTTLPQATYSWRVRAVDRAGNVSVWSAARELVLVAGNTALPTPVPVVPIEPTEERRIRP